MCGRYALFVVFSIKYVLISRLYSFFCVIYNLGRANRKINLYLFKKIYRHMINAIIVDDEMNAIKALSLELKNFRDRISIIGHFSNASGAIEFLKNNEIDVVFLDMEMPEMTGLDFLERFQQRNFLVVFTTAFSKYALNAIKQEAVYYLLKPIDIMELETCLNRIEKTLMKDAFEEKLDEALNKLNQIKGGPQKVKLSYDGKIIFYRPDDILYGEGDGNYSWVHFEKKNKVLITKKLKQLEDDLPEPIFYRVHNSYIINLNKIKAYNKNEGVVILENNTVIPVSRQKRNNILSKI